MPHTISSLDPRTLELLDSSKAAFAAKGFDGASMQDLARAAGMSAGNFYRYFPSKEAIIAAIVARDLEEVRAEFLQIIGSPNPTQTFRNLVRRRIEELELGHDPIFAEITASAPRRPDLAALMLQFETEVLDYLTQVFGRIANVAAEQAQSKFMPQAQFVMLLVRGLSIGGCSGQPLPAANHALAELVMDAIERTLAEVASAAPLISIQLRA